MSIFKRAKAAAESVADAILPLDVTAAQKALDERAAALVAAQKAVSSAEAALDASFDDAKIKDIPQLEAALADSKLTAERAQRAWHSAQRRLNEAKEREADAGKADATAKRDAALQRRGQAAAEIDRLAAQIAEQVKKFDAETDALVLAAVAGVASRAPQYDGRCILRAALTKSGAIESIYRNDLKSASSGSDIAELARGAVLAV